MNLRPEWEWGWKTPLLLHPVLPPESLPTAIRDFLATPLENIDFASGEKKLHDRIAELRTSRLGSRFERIQEALFLGHPDTASLRSSIVIPQRTEIDLLHRLRTWPEGWIHWEVAVKFYLALDRDGTTDLHRLVGPSLQDTLGKKVRTIETKQLPILRDLEVRRAIGIPESDPVASLALVRGVFYRPHDAVTELAVPDRVTAWGARGIWISSSAFPAWIAKTAQENHSTHFHLFTDRREWLRETPSGTGTELKEYLNSPLATAIRAHFEAVVEAGSMITPLHGSLTGNGLPEIRVFIVDDDWRNRAEAMLDRLRHEGRI